LLGCGGVWRWRRERGDGVDGGGGCLVVDWRRRGRRVDVVEGRGHITAETDAREEPPEPARLSTTATATTATSVYLPHRSCPNNLLSLSPTVYCRLQRPMYVFSGVQQFNTAGLYTTHRSAQCRATPLEEKEQQELGELMTTILAKLSQVSELSTHQQTRSRCRRSSDLIFERFRPTRTTGYTTASDIVVGGEGSRRLCVHKQ